MDKLSAVNALLSMAVAPIQISSHDLERANKTIKYAVEASQALGGIICGSESGMRRCEEGKQYIALIYKDGVPVVFGEFVFLTNDVVKGPALFQLSGK